MSSKFESSLTFSKAIMAIACCGSDQTPLQYAKDTWGEDSRVVRVLKASVTGTTTATVLADVTAASAELNDLVAQRSVLGRLEGAQRVPLNTRILIPTSDPQAFWVVEGKPKPASAGAGVSVTLPPSKVVTMLVVTKELSRFGTMAELLIRNMTTRALAAAQDARLLSAVNGGGTLPSGLAFGVTAIPSSGDAHEDIASLWENFAGDPASAVLVTDPKTAVGLAVIRTTDGIATFPDVGPRGGTVLGIPLLTTKGSPRDSSGGQLMLIDASSVAFGDGLVRVDKSESSSIQMLDNPTNDITTPTATSVVSMFQANSVAVRADAECNWTVARAGSVSLVTGCLYV